MTAKGTYFPRRTNDHVPNMQYAADVRFGGLGTIVIPACGAAGTDAVAEDVDADATGKTLLAVEADAKFGRTVTVVASAATGGNTVTEVRGKDYLGQPMVERVTVTNANGTTAQSGKKAFKWIESVEVITPATNAVTLDVGFGNGLGLPYKSQKLISELVNKEVPTAGTFVDGVATGTTQSATSDDPRGLYTPHSSFLPDGTREYELTFMHDTDNLHGDPHYYA